MRPCELRCPSGKCSPECSVVRHGFQRTKTGRRRRYLCRGCGRTFTSRTKSAYLGIHLPSSKFDLVAHLSVEGMNRSAIARVVGVSRSTVVRWLDRITARARRFNEHHLKALKYANYRRTRSARSSILRRMRSGFSRLWK